MKDKKKPNKLNYQKCKIRLTEFIKHFQDQDIYYEQEYYKIFGKKKYLIELQKIANLDSKSIEIQVADIEFYLQKDDQKQMVRTLRTNTLRYLHIFEEIIAEVMPEKNKILNPQEEITQKYKYILKNHRKNNLEGKNSAQNSKNESIPYKLDQFYDVNIVFGSNLKYSTRTISEIKSEDIGSLISTRAIVVRSSDVKPQLQVATYACDVCGFQIYETVNDSSQYKPLTECKSKKCRENNVSGKIIFLPGYSKFRAYQELKVQQTPQQLLRGAIPKSLRLQVRGSLTNKVCPGDLISVQGIVLPKRIKKGYHQDMYFESYFYVTKIIQEKKKYSDFNIDENELLKIKRIRQEMTEEDLINNLAKSISPEIYGLQSVKKALLLQMAGGQTIQTNDNLRIRGQINIALFGDPGIAKSQLLKHISYISPRAVYTTGKGSSGVGLTAAIVADPVTKQLSLEAGALVLADMGVCCIDQFDKMDEYDRTAIHEVMQQQTVSITKAGMITTLNARTAVLAAANPIYGRYDPGLSTQKNLNLPAALLSRFDLIFVLLDKSNKQKDIELAKHIGNVHRKKKAEINGVFDEKFLKNYLSLARQYQPVIPEQIHESIITKYINNRQLQMDKSNEGESYTTMRSLLALIRLSQARAKLRFSNVVSEMDVLDCIQIIDESQIKTQIDGESKKKIDPMSILYEMIKSQCDYTKQRKVELQKVFYRGISRGFSRQFIENTIKNYQNLDVLWSDGISVGFVD